MVHRMKSEKKDWVIRAAMDADKAEIYALYQAQIGREYCAWDAHYPGMKDIEYDLSRDALFVMCDESARIIASISLDLDEQVEMLSCWTPELQPGGELSRLAVAEDMQNQGIARKMLIYAMQVLAERGKKSVHFLVNKYNEKALRSYAHLQCQCVGTCELYDQPFLCFEKEL